MTKRITSPEDLKSLRDHFQAELDLRTGPKAVQVTVHLGTCGIAAGARDIVAELVAELDRNRVQTVTVRQSGCIGLCEQEPMLTYSDKTGNNYLYVKLTKAKVREIIERHVRNGEPVEQYILKGAAT